MTYRIKNCRVYGADPALNAKNELLFTVENGVSRIISAPNENEKITDIDGKGGLLFPAFTDIGCEFYDKDHPSRDSLETAHGAARVGGYRRLAVISDSAETSSDSKILPISHINIEKIPENTIVYGKYGRIPRDKLLETFKDLKKNNCTYISAGIDENTVGGSFSKSLVSVFSEKGGISRFDECAGLFDELFAAYESGCRIHIRAIGSLEALEMIRQAKKAGVKVTCGVSPFHLTLIENDVPFYGTMCKLLPPLRSKKDRDALREGVLDRSIDCISSLHTPRTADEKLSGGGPSFGICSFETAFSALNTYFPELITHYPDIFADVMAINPSRILGEKFILKEGARADLVLADTESEIIVSGNSLRSKSTNSPYLGQTLCGSVRLIYNGY